MFWDPEWGRESSAVTFRAHVRGKYKLQGGVRFRSSSARNGSSGEGERGAKPCEATVRGYVPRASLRRNPKDVADCLKFVGLFTFTGRGSSRKTCRLAARHRLDN
jgi:hypothetical protein